jgi:dTDP-4-amino-4,6-dideoxygalactose transaminase
MPIAAASKPPSPSTFFPACNDGGIIVSLVISAIRTARTLTPDFEVIVVNDYPVPLARQAAFESVTPEVCRVADATCREILSLPFHPGLESGEVATVADPVRSLSPADPPR